MSSSSPSPPGGHAGEDTLWKRVRELLYRNIRDQLKQGTVIAWYADYRDEQEILLASLTTADSEELTLSFIQRRIELTQGKRVIGK